MKPTPADIRLINDSVEALRDRAVELLVELVRIPSVNRPPTGEEQAVQQYYADVLRKLGLEVHTFEPGDVMEFESHPLRRRDHDMTGRPDVVGMLPGSGSGRSMMLLSHADVVSPGVDGIWTDGNPFSGSVRNGRVYGRGACDDKWGMAAGAMVAHVLARAGVSLAGDLVIASVADEEHSGGNGSVALMARGVRTDGCIYLDGENMCVGVANLGGGRVGMELTLPGNHLNLQAMLDYFEQIRRAMDAFADKRAELFRQHPLYHDSWVIEHTLRCVRVELGKDGPGTGWAQMRYYLLPDEDVNTFRQSLQQAVDAVTAKGQCRLVWPDRDVPASSVDPAGELPTVLGQAYEVATGLPAVISGTTMNDMGIINRCDVPCVMFGPARFDGPGSPHGIDEYIDIEQYLFCIRTAALAVMQWCSYRTM